jgi:hypothetical protein
MDNTESTSGAKREALSLMYLRQLPLEAMIAAATSFEYGANKYSSRNWEKGLPWQQLIDSLRRHLDDFERGMDYDNGEDGSDLPQVCMIMASAMMLTTSYLREIGEDDRLPAPLNSQDSKSIAKRAQIWLEDSRLNKTF